MFQGMHEGSSQSGTLGGCLYITNKKGGANLHIYTVDANLERTTIIKIEIQ